MIPIVRFIAMAASALWLAGCAARPANEGGVREMRLLAKPADEAIDSAAISALAAKASGRPSRYVAAVGGNWHALAIACVEPDECEDALRRMAGAPEFAAVQRDGRKTIVSP